MLLKNSPNCRRSGLWLLAGIYTYLLQYAIVIWFFLNEKIGVFLTRITSPLIILLIYIFITVLFIKQKKSIKNHPGKIITISGVILFIFMYQPQQQKLIHVPEYILLSFIVYTALKIDLHSNNIFPVTGIVTTCLGTIDELLQGIHPFRYYGSEDIIVNSLSVLIGVCTIGMFKKNHIPSPKWEHYPIRLFLLILAIAVLASFNIFALFDEAAQHTRFQSFSTSLLIMDIIAFITGIIVLVFICFYNKIYSSDIIASICSVTVTLEVIIGISVFCKFYSVEFV